MVVTANETTSVADQIRLFNNFDILITSHGSHLANGIFTMNPHRKAVIEVVPFAFDSVFYGNFNSLLGFNDYLMSSGHLTPEMSVFGKYCSFREFKDFSRVNCSISKHGYQSKIEQEW